MSLKIKYMRLTDANLNPAARKKERQIYGDELHNIT